MKIKGLKTVFFTAKRKAQRSLFLMQDIRRR